MNRPPDKLETRWSRRRWLTVVTIILAAQVIGATALSRAPKRKAAPRVPQPQIRLALVQASDLTAMGMDPTLFALVNERGFSGGAWLQRAPLRPHQLNDWSEPPQWLPLPAERLTRDFQMLARSNSVRQPTARELPPPRSEAPEINPHPLPARTIVLLSLPLERRGLLEPIPADTWIADDVLKDTVVQVSIDPSGAVISTRLIASCGLAAADQHALAVAARARFAALTTADKQSLVGTITFKWSTTTAPPGSIINLVP